MKLRILMIIAVIFILISCDPAQELEFQNTSPDVAGIKFYFKPGKIRQYDKFYDFMSEDSLVIYLKPGEKKIYNFGIGTWEVYHSLDTLGSHIKEIKLETKASTVIIKGENQIKTFLSKNLIDDRYKARIVIEIK